MRHVASNIGAFGLLLVALFSLSAVLVACAALAFLVYCSAESQLVARGQRRLLK